MVNTPLPPAPVLSKVRAGGSISAARNAGKKGLGPTSSACFHPTPCGRRRSFYQIKRHLQDCDTEDLPQKQAGHPRGGLTGLVQALEVLGCFPAFLMEKRNAGVEIDRPNQHLWRKKEIGLYDVYGTHRDKV